MPDIVNYCGTGDWSGPVPGDPDNNVILSAVPAFGGIDVSWTYPTLNPHAVIHTLLYRGTTNIYGFAALHKVVSGNFFYDKVDAAIQYYYWIQIVSINGTTGDAVGPATATAQPLIADLIEQLTGEIDSGVLATSLRTELDQITLIDGALSDEILARFTSNTALAAALDSVQTSVDEAATLLFNEVTTRTSDNSALVTALNVVAASASTNTAAIITESTTRATADTALAASITLLEANVGDDIAAAVLVEQTARTTADTALASSITTAQTTLNASIATAQTTLQTNINTVDGEVTNIGALYTAELTVEGLVGGFGVYNDATTVEAGFDVDTFWIGRTAANKRKPFIVSGGVVYIDEAAINTLTFSKLRNSTGSVVVDSDKLLAEHIYATNLSTISADLGSITAGSIRGVNVNAASHTTKGSYLTTSAANADTTLNVRTTDDFAASGSGWIIDTTNDRDAFTYTGKTATTLTGCSGVLIHNNGATIIPQVKNILIDSATNEMRFYGDMGGGVIEELVAIGLNPSGGDNNAATFGSSTSGCTRVGVFGKSYSSYGAAGQSNSYIGTVGISTSSRGVHGLSTTNIGVFGDGATYDFYAGGAGTNYGPFTGGHDGLVNISDEFEQGDIIVDAEILFHRNLSNTIGRNILSSFPMEKGVVGVFGWRQELSCRDLPSAISEIIDISILDYINKYSRISFNAVGEGQINVCKEGGNLETGDLICSSSTPGKGMKQPDDLVHGYTVAKVRENITWEEGDNSIKMVACIYLCG